MYCNWGSLSLFESKRNNLKEILLKRIIFSAQQHAKIIRRNLNPESGARMLLSLKVNQPAIPKHIENYV